MVFAALNAHVAVLTGLLASSPPAAMQPFADQVRVGTQVISYQPPVTAEQARDVAALLEMTSPYPQRPPARLSRAEDGYALRLAFPGGSWRHPQIAPWASLAGRLVSASVLDGAPVTVHVSDDAFASKRTLRIELAPEDAPFYRGEALVALGRSVEAIEQFGRAVELRPENTRYLLRYGEALMADWRDAEAERAFRTAIEKEPDNALAHFLLGELTFQQGRLQAALPLYRRAVELEPGLAPAHEMLGSTYDLMGRFDEAIAHYERAIQLAPSPTLYTELGITYRNKKQLDEAIRQFQQGIELFPDDALLHRNLADTLKMAGRGNESGRIWARGIELYRGAVAREPENPDHHASLAYMMAEVQDFEGAIASFQRALALDPRAPLTWGGLGDAYLRTKRFDEAIDAFRKMVELQPKDGFAHHRLARALEAAGRAAEAEEVTERARRLGYPPR